MKVYLGDGAYVEFSGYDFRVYTSDGILRRLGGPPICESESQCDVGWAERRRARPSRSSTLLIERYHGEPPRTNSVVRRAQAIG